MNKGDARHVCVCVCVRIGMHKYVYVASSAPRLRTYNSFIYLITHLCDD